jgi:hypothetical protein
METVTPESDFVALPSAEPMPARDLGLVTAQDETTVVLLAGPVASGKTTVLVSLYELLNEGPVGGLLFAGSKTLIGFERICHPNRAASALQAPATLRTNPSSPTAFLHLRVADTAGERPRMASLLVSDVTGEAFDEARDVANPTIIPKEVWRRADILCIVLDADKLSVATKRQTVRAHARSLLRSARESKLLQPRCKLQIVTTKWDLVVNSQTEDFVTETESLLKEQFGPSFESVSAHRIAARPTSTRMAYAYGVPSLLTEWVSRPRSKPVVAIPDDQARSGINSFARRFWERERSRLAGVLNAI